MSDQIDSVDFDVDLLQALLWQYNNASQITSLVESKNNWYQLAQTDFWENWITDIFSLTTANLFGLDVWAIILGFPLQFVSPESTRPAFGFGSFNKNFNQGTFSELSGGGVKLTVAERRQVLQLIYFKTFARCTTPALNAMLKYIFASQGSAYVIDGNDMTMQYTFNFSISTELLYVFQNFDVLPRPATVKLSIVINNISVTPFGFGIYNQNFNNGNF